MGYMVIDTENTGLFRHKHPDGTVARSDEPGQPRMAEFAAVICDNDFTVSDTYQRWIKPDLSWRHENGELMTKMPEEAFNANGLTFEFLTEHGVPVREVLEWFSENIKDRILLGFNQQHDGRQMRGELRRAGMPDLFEDTPAICAMRSITTNYKGMVKKLNGKGGFPRLIDAAHHFEVPGYEAEKHHKGYEDARATAWVARCLHERGLLLPAAVHRHKGMEDVS